MIICPPKMTKTTTRAKDDEDFILLLSSGWHLLPFYGQHSPTLVFRRRAFVLRALISLFYIWKEFLKVRENSRLKPNVGEWAPTGKMQKVLKTSVPAIHLLASRKK
jgi:hypothetical protein